MEVLLVVLSVIWAILCIVLFFKIWGACNNIALLVKTFVPESLTPETKEEIEEWLEEEKNKK